MLTIVSLTEQTELIGEELITYLEELTVLDDATGEGYFFDYAVLTKVQRDSIADKVNDNDVVELSGIKYMQVIVLDGGLPWPLKEKPNIISAA